MTLNILGTVQAWAWFIASLAILFFSASLLPAEENGPEATKTIVLSPHSQARIRPIVIMHTLAQIDAETLEAPATGPAGKPDSANAGTVQFESPDSGMQEIIPPADNGKMMTRQTPATGKLFGYDDTDNLFGMRGGYLHPFLGIREEYTDNVYNIEMDKVENFLTTVSAGAWLSVPRLHELPLYLVPHNAAVGGARYLAPGNDSFERFQTYLRGGIDYKTFSADSELDYTAWHLEGMYQQNLPAGISFRVMDRYSRDQDRFDIGSFQPEDFVVASGSISVRTTPSQIRNYASNQAIFSTSVAMGERFSALVNFINFFLDYEDNEDEWLDRTDNSLGLVLSYKYSPKTSFFLEYDRADIAYSRNTGNDSENSFFYGGINWQGSAKTSLVAKGGYQLKQYDIEDTEDSGTFSLEGQLNYLITDKTKIGFNLYRMLEETDSLQNRGRETTAARLRYDQRFTYRIQGGLELGYEQNDYDGFARAQANFPAGEGRRDARYLVRPSFNYFFRDWLIAELAYAFEDRNSTDTYYDFTSQTVLLSINAAF
jgi:hypothetical protein